MPPKVQMQLDADCAVCVARSFAAPREVVWRAFTDPIVLAQWMLGPPGWRLDTCEVSLTVGGGYLWRWRDPDTGQGFGFQGTYSVVDPCRTLVDTQIIDQSQGGHVMAPTQNTVVFEDLDEGDSGGFGQGCRVATTIRYADAATRDAIVAQGLGAGMEAAYHRLDPMLIRVAA